MHMCRCLITMHTDPWLDNILASYYIIARNFAMRQLLLILPLYFSPVLFGDLYLSSWYKYNTIYIKVAEFSEKFL